MQNILMLKTDHTHSEVVQSLNLFNLHNQQFLACCSQMFNISVAPTHTLYKTQSACSTIIRHFLHLTPVSRGEAALTSPNLRMASSDHKKFGQSTSFLLPQFEDLRFNSLIPLHLALMIGEIRSFPADPEMNRHRSQHWSVTPQILFVCVFYVCVCWSSSLLLSSRTLNDSGMNQQQRTVLNNTNQSAFS